MLVAAGIRRHGLKVMASGQVEVLFAAVLVLVRGG